MSDIDIQGCPAPQNITFVQRLQPLVGRTVTVFQPGIPLTKTTGKLSHVTADSFRVGTNEVDFNTSFFIVTNERVITTKPYDLTASAEDIGSLHGKLIRVGRNFVEFVKIPGRDVPTIFPLNLFTEVICEREHEE
ncbi:hypothetical protein [Paenibacillus hamazuiensis]|uniref:hypothetical protein n=1 Tax=Paenibacillus hamazuiensis TaxID=2936508 RepID=UPI00200BC3C5|nr:hypothetical protein [Paenibacillus hamazuiensis]